MNTKWLLTTLFGFFIPVNAFVQFKPYYTGLTSKIDKLSLKPEPINFKKNKEDCDDCDPDNPLEKGHDGNCNTPKSKTPIEKLGWANDDKKDNDLIEAYSAWFGFPAEEKWKGVRYTVYAILGGYLLGDLKDEVIHHFNLENNPFFDILS